MRRLLDGRSESLVLSHLPVGVIVLWHRSRQKRGYRDSVTNKTMGVICSPQERVCRGRRIATAKTRCGVNRNVIAGDAAVSRIKNGARHAARQGPPPGGDIVLMF